MKNSYHDGCTYQCNGASPDIDTARALTTIYGAEAPTTAGMTEAPIKGDGSTSIDGRGAVAVAGMFSLAIPFLFNQSRVRACIRLHLEFTRRILILA